MSLERDLIQPTAEQKALVGLRLELTPVLIGWSKVAPGANNREIDADVVEIYAGALSKIKITVRELEAARDSILATQKFFPTVAEIVEFVKEYRRHNAFADYVAVLDVPGGHATLMVPPDKAHNGVYLPQGGGNGRPCRPMAEVQDILEPIRERREELGGVTSLAALGERMGMAPALPERKPLTAAESEALIQQAKDSAESRRNGA